MQFYFLQHDICPESCWVKRRLQQRRRAGHYQQREATRTYLPKPAIPDLFQVEKTVAAQVCGLQELDWTRGKKKEEFSAIKHVRMEQTPPVAVHYITELITFCWAASTSQACLRNLLI